MSAPACGSERALVVGRHGPAEHGDDHPDDAKLYRRLANAGHRVSVPATEMLQRALTAFAADRCSSAIELGAAGPVLDEIDLFLYRGDPNRCGYGDSRILEAMAAARAPIVFAMAIGAREWIADGVNG